MVGMCGQEGKWRDGDGGRRGLFFGFSASVIKLSHVKDRWSSVCVCLCAHARSHLQVESDVTLPAFYTHTHTHKAVSPGLYCASSRPSLGSQQTSAICSQSARRVGWLISGRLTQSAFSFPLFLPSRTTSTRPLSEDFLNTSLLSSRTFWCVSYTVRSRKCFPQSLLEGNQTLLLMSDRQFGFCLTCCDFFSFMYSKIQHLSKIVFFKFYHAAPATILDTLQGASACR